MMATTARPGSGHAPEQAAGPFGIILLGMTGLAERMG